MKNPRSSKAVSELVGEILLFVIGVTSVSMIFLRILWTLGPVGTPIVTINEKIEVGGERLC